MTPPTPEEELKEEAVWKLYVDGSVNSKSSGAGLILVSPENVKFQYALSFKFKTSKNEADYEALITRLKIANELKVLKLVVYCDSQLVVSQVNESPACPIPCLWYPDANLESKRAFSHSQTLSRDPFCLLARNESKGVAVGEEGQKKITALKDDNEEWCDHPETLKELVRNDYLSLYAEDGTTDAVLPTPCSSWCLADNEVDKLMLPISKLEVQRALFSMNPNKSPGFDGLPASFFQKAWNQVGNDLFELVLKAFDQGHFPEELNRTLICLIPKVEGPERIAQFRPYSLCSVPMKVITKVIVERIRPYLTRIISKNQSSFLPGRHRVDNIIVVQEILHSMRTMKRAVAIKIDLEKAYDRIRWSFLEKVLQEVGFPENWIKLIIVHSY
ncbi:hypothetical protein ZIOFF_074362 (mitochondrion) [Zingiber officinale]|uniref:Reverse transcriptase domain-containing protein n=1 Tax=Zingiber officinale TaxID=94328 RepID=A0A8J5C244_ZINOF|nr:hypothetical protein ZIOFF_074362 [Zingiber officinale]